VIGDQFNLQRLTKKKKTKKKNQLKHKTVVKQITRTSGDVRYIRKYEHVWTV